jgi:N-acetyltransferase
MMMMMIERVTLQGSLVRLEPLRITHAPALYAASRDPQIWAYLAYPQPRSLADMEHHIATFLAEERAGARLPFAVINRHSGRAVGETGYHDILRKEHGLEIGVTWLASSLQRTGVNTESKYLLLCHAFETLDAVRVQFRTRMANVKAQRAIERLGAVREGVLRNSLPMPDGSYSDRILYSIIASEWPAVKAHLETVLQR